MGIVAWIEENNPQYNTGVMFGKELKAECNTGLMRCYF